MWHHSTRDPPHDIMTPETLSMTSWHYHTWVSIGRDQRPRIKCIILLVRFKNIAASGLVSCEVWIRGSSGEGGGGRVQGGAVEAHTTHNLARITLHLSNNCQVATVCHTFRHLTEQLVERRPPRRRWINTHCSLNNYKK